MQDPTAFAMAIGTIGPALGIGLIGAAALLAMARNPQISDRLQVTMLIAIAFTEAIGIYALVVALILRFVH